MATDYYSGTAEEMKTFLASAGIGTSRMDAIDPTVFAIEQTNVEDEIDGLLSSVLYTPIQKVVDKDDTSVYPGVIRMLAKKRLASNLIGSYFGEVQPNVSALGVKWKAESDEVLRQLQNREITLRGQVYKHANRFIPPEVAPKMPPGAAPAGGV